MRKGFVFTILFALVFMLFLFAARSYLESTQSKARDMAGARLSPEAYIVDDITYDMVYMLGANASFWRNSSHMRVFLSDSIPSPILNASKELSEYEQFIEGEYANLTNVWIELNMSGLEQPSIGLGLLTCNYDSIKKSTLKLNGSERVERYDVSVHLDKNCLDSNCSSATSRSWVWDTNGIYAQVQITDKANNEVFAGQGYVDASVPHRVRVNVSGGYFELEIYKDAAPCLSMRAENVTAGTVVNATLNESARPKVTIPVGVRANNMRVSELALWKE